MLTTPKPPITKGKHGEYDLVHFLDSLASASAIPGGGSSAALAGAVAAGLVAMVCRVTLKKPSNAEVDELGRVARQADELRAELMTLIELDGESFQRVVEAYKTKRDAEIQAALEYATEVPLRTAAFCGETLTLAALIAPKARKSTLSDLQVGALIAQAALRGAVVTAETNLRDIHDEGFVAAQRARITKMSVEAEKDLARVNASRGTEEGKMMGDER